MSINKFFLKDRSSNKFKMYINQFKFNSSLSSSSIDFMFFKKLNYLFLFILIFLMMTTVSASSISRNEEINHDFLCANHAHDTGDCQIFAREKWGTKKDERSLCCLFLEVKECILKKREEYCRGDIMESFRKTHNDEINQLKSKKCKHYFQNSNCDEEFEIWTLAAMIMLCLISGMACITLAVLYTKK